MEIVGDDFPRARPGQTSTMGDGPIVMEEQPEEPQVPSHQEVDENSLPEIRQMKFLSLRQRISPPTTEESKDKDIQAFKTFLGLDDEAQIATVRYMEHSVNNVGPTTFLSQFAIDMLVKWGFFKDDAGDDKELIHRLANVIMPATSFLPSTFRDFVVLAASTFKHLAPKPTQSAKPSEMFDHLPEDVKNRFSTEKAPLPSFSMGATFRAASLSPETLKGLVVEENDSDDDNEESVASLVP